MKVELLVDLPPPGFDGPADDPNQPVELPEGFDPEQLGVPSSQQDPAQAHVEALRRSLNAPPLNPRRRRINVGRLVIGFLLVLLAITLFIMARLYLDGDLG